MPSTRCVPGNKHSSRLGVKDTYLLSLLGQPKSKFLKGDLCHMSIEFLFKPLAPQNGCNPDLVIGS